MVTFHGYAGQLARPALIIIFLSFLIIHFGFIMIDFGPSRSHPVTIGLLLYTHVERCLTNMIFDHQRAAAAVCS